ncbi:MAG: shikimate kinase [Minwuia thermotolerans]|nr:MAG: shikimate kinase [Minwuia thermotolerans]
MVREAAQGVMFEGAGEAREDDRRSLVLVGLMGAGKSTVGRRLAQRLNLRFVDADDEIEAAAGMTIPEIFERYGEAHFRDGERRVIRRLLQEPRQVIATGGGAFMNDETRALIAAEAISIWLKADLDTLVRRCAKRTDRPLLRGRNQRDTLADLMQQRYPVYETSDLMVESGGDTHDVVVDRIIGALGQPVEPGDRTVQR